MKTIVIVDNDKLSVEALANVLIKEEYTVYKAYDGLEGLATIRAAKPDCVLLDLFMPGIDGIRLCRYLKTDQEFANLKVIILSPLTLNGTIRIMDAYADAYIAKGFIMDVMDNTMRLLKALAQKSPRSPDELALGFEGRSPRVVVDELIAERKHFETILYNVGDGILETNVDDLITYINPVGKKIIQKPELSIVGQNLVDVLGKRYDGQFQEILYKLRSARTLINHETVVEYGKKTLNIDFTNIISDEKGYAGSLLIFQDVTYLTEKIRELSLLNEVGKLLTSTLDFDEVLHILMSQIQKIMQVEAASLLLVEKETGDLVFEVALGSVGEEFQHHKIAAGQGLVGWVAKTGKSVLIPDVSVDPRFDRRFDESTGFVTKSMICVPLKIREEVIGVIQVLNHQDGRPFNEDNVHLLSSISMYASIAIDHARLFQAKGEG